MQIARHFFQDFPFSCALSPASSTYAASSSIPSKRRVPRHPSGKMLNSQLCQARRFSLANGRNLGKTCGPATRNQPQLPKNSQSACRLESAPKSPFALLDNKLVKNLIVRARARTKTENELAQKYSARINREGSDLYINPLRIGLLFEELFTDLEEKLPAYRELFSMMKGVAGSLRSARPGRKRSTFSHASNLGTPDGKLSIPKYRTAAVQSPEVPPRSLTRISLMKISAEGALLRSQDSDQPVGRQKQKKTPTGTELFDSASELSLPTVEGRERNCRLGQPQIHQQRTMDATDSKKRAGKVPKLNLRKLSCTSHVGYNEEFVGKLDEFSMSWRAEVESMKTFGKEDL